MNQSHESNAAWIWRHTAQHISFDEWRAQQEAAAEAKAAAEKQQRLQALLHQSLAAAAAKFGTATLL